VRRAAAAREPALQSCCCRSPASRKPRIGRLRSFGCESRCEASSFRSTCAASQRGAMRSLPGRVCAREAVAAGRVGAREAVAAGRFGAAQCGRCQAESVRAKRSLQGASVRAKRSLQAGSARREAVAAGRRARSGRCKPSRSAGRGRTSPTRHGDAWDPTLPRSRQSASIALRVARHRQGAAPARGLARPRSPPRPGCATSTRSLCRMNRGCCPVMLNAVPRGNHAASACSIALARRHSRR